MANSKSSYSYNGTYFALLSVDNRLRIWEVTTGKLLREYNSSCAVESTCTCLSWTRDLKDNRKRKKEKNQRDQLSNILIGHNDGGVVSYNTISDKLQTIFSGGHSKKVNDISYNHTNENFYTCSDDKHIVEWNLNSKEMVSKWKGGKHQIRRVTVSPSGKNLLSAGMSIKLWDLETKNQLIKFDGHAFPISLLQFSPYRSADKKTDDDDGCYFFSTSSEDRHISSWQINHSQPDRSKVATFMTSEVPVFLNSIVEKSDQSLKMAVACNNGTIEYFSLQMNGKVSKPIESIKKLIVQKKENGATTPAHFYRGFLQHEKKEIFLNFVGGSTMKPFFNSFNFTTADPIETIVKEEKHDNIFMDKHSRVIEDSVQTVQIRGKQHVIGNTFVSARLDINENVREKQKSNNMSMYERLKNREIVKPDMNANAASVSVLLTQGLHTKDMSLMEGVISKSFQKSVLQNTLRRMTSNDVVELLELIVERIHQTPTPSASALANMMAWTKSILTIHLSSLLLMPNVREVTSKLFNLLRSQQEIFPTLFRLQGKLDLIISQISMTSAEIRKEKDQNEDLFNPCIVFHDDSDDDDVIDRIKKDGDEEEDDDEEDDEEEEDESDTGDSESDEEMVDSKQKKENEDLEDSSDSGTY